MLLIAVTGPVGSGKTTLLATLAAWSAAQGRPAEGFLAHAVRRRFPDRGADAYEIQWLGEGHRGVFAQRRQDGQPDYVFDDEIQVEARAWAATLRKRLPAALVILDEFGPREVRGQGHALLWPDVAAADPDVVVIAVREGLVPAVAALLGRSFDLVIDTRDAAAWERLRSACREQEDWQRVGTYGAVAGSVEVGIGSALHGFGVPGRGLILSSFQAMVMTGAGEGLGRRHRVVWVPFIAAGLKALSPAGSRLRPMLAITLQGLLFGGATGVLGWNTAGVALGGWLIGCWAAAQGLVLQFMLVGNRLLDAYAAVTAWAGRHWGASTPSVALALGIWVGLHGLATLSAALFVHRRQSLPDRFRQLLHRQEEALPALETGASRTGPLHHALREMTRPFFWLPPLLIGLIVVASGADWSGLFWMLVRVATVGFVMFSLARSCHPRRVAAWLRAHGFWGPALALERAMREGGNRRR